VSPKIPVELLRCSINFRRQSKNCCICKSIYKDGPLETSSLKIRGIFGGRPLKRTTSGKQAEPRCCPKNCSLVYKQHLARVYRPLPNSKHRASSLQLQTQPRLFSPTAALPQRLLSSLQWWCSLNALLPLARLLSSLRRPLLLQWPTGEKALAVVAAMGTSGQR
jgi:hypothetical protein